MFGCGEMQEIREAVGRYAAGFDPALVTAAQAKRIVADAVAAENMLATVKALAAKRVADTELWRSEGDPTPAHHLARTSGSSVGAARAALETAARLGELAVLDAAARRGELSPAQAAPVAEAAAKAPGAERRLVATAKRVSLGELRDECARTKAAAEPDDEARHRAIHASRFLRRRRLADGAGELCYRSTLEEVAEIFAIAQGRADRAFRAARAESRREPAEAYLADGLLEAVRASRRPGQATAAGGGGAAPAETADAGATEAQGGGDGAESGEGTGAGRAEGGGEGTGAGRAEGGGDPAAQDAGADAPARPARPPSPAKVVVRVDWDALVRGWPIDGEVCEIAGLGPVAVSAVRAMIASGDAFLAAVVTRGVDVVNVAHLGRHPSAHQRTALEWRSPQCTALGCTATMRLENDHRLEWASTKVTLLSALDPCCGHHHDLKTYKGWAFVEGSGKRAMVPPGDPRHPGNALHGPAPPRAPAVVG